MQAAEDIGGNGLVVRGEMNRKRIAIVGAGMGGLALALRLSHRGHAVTVFEKNSFVGGRCHRIRVGDCQFDAGPTLLMMLDPFRKLFSDVGERFEDHLMIHRCDPSYRTFFRDGTRLDASVDRSAMLQQMEAMGARRDAQRYEQFLSRIRDLYEVAVPNFVRNDYNSAWDFLAPSQLARVVRHRMLSNLGRQVGRTFSDERLRMLFSFQTLYLGLSPNDAPWVYATLAHMEYGEGIFYPRGGLAEVAYTIYRLAEKRGATFRLATPVCRTERGRVLLESGERHEFDAVILNADLPYASQRLLKERGRSRRMSCSALAIYLDVDGDLDGLEHHNVFFGGDFRANLDEVFHRLAPPQDPSFYACVSARRDPDVAPKGRNNLFLLVPVPNLDRPLSPTEIETLRSKVFARLGDEIGFDAANIRAEHRCTPQDWEAMFNLERLATFGLAHDTLQSAMFRPGLRSKTDASTYFVGASTIPGNGLPMVLISAELVEKRLVADGAIAA